MDNNKALEKMQPVKILKQAATVVFWLFIICIFHRLWKMGLPRAIQFLRIVRQSMF